MTGAKSNKPSKRQTLHQKNKVLKKIAEHHRKVRKEARKNPNKRAKLKKDPGIPNLWPYKGELMDKISAEKLRAEEEAKLARLEKREQLAELRRRAEEAEGDYEDRQHEVNEKARFIDSSRTSYFKEFKKVVKASDVIIQVLDARDPMGTRCPEIEKQILAEDPKKKIVLVLNKIDLVSRQNLVEWLKVLRNELPTIAFKSSTQQQRHNLGQHHMPKTAAKLGINKADMDAKFEDEVGVADCLGASTLISLLKNYARSKDMKLSITVGIIGIPNVGKSSLINSLKRSRAVGVGSTPGFTKAMQEVVLDKNIKLLDCPGIIFTSASSEAEAVLRNSVKHEQLKDPISPVELILGKCTKEQMMEIYKIAEFDGVVEFLTQVAKKRGKMKAGAVVDLDGAAKLVIQDWNGGKIPYMSRPPKDISQISAAIVPSWSAEFNIAAVEALEAEHVLQQVPEKSSEQFVNIQANSSLKPELMMLKDYDDDSENEMDADGSSEAEDGEMEVDDEEGSAKQDKVSSSSSKQSQSSSNSMVIDKKLAVSSNPGKKDETRKNKLIRDAAKKSAKRKRDESTLKKGSMGDYEESSDSEEEYNFGEDFWTRGKQQPQHQKPSSSNFTDVNDFSI